MNILIRHTPRHLAFCIAVFALLVLSDVSWAADAGPRKPSKQDKCPVCGMFVYKYPDWVGQVIFKDGSVDFFDGAKDLFKYYFNLKKYNPKKSKSDIQAVYVSEYYKMEPLNAHNAYFVIGSDVYGPMGKELIPLATQADAEAFRKDHKGKRILGFQEVTPKVLEKLD